MKKKTELTPEQKYLQMGREMEFGMDDTDRESFAFVYEASDESESTVYDNSNDYNADDKAEELTEEELEETDGGKTRNFYAHGCPFCNFMVRGRQKTLGYYS